MMNITSQDILLVIDFQNVYLPGQPWACPAMPRAMENTLHFINKSGINHILLTRFTADQNAPGCWQKYNREYAQINADPFLNELAAPIRPLAGKYPLIEKSTYSSLKCPDVLSYIQKTFTGPSGRLPKSPQAAPWPDSELHSFDRAQSASGRMPSSALTAALQSNRQLKSSQTTLWPDSGLHPRTSEGGQPASGRLFLAGVVAECCILATMMDAIDLGYECVYMPDCIAGQSVENEARIQALAESFAPVHTQVLLSTCV